MSALRGPSRQPLPIKARWVPLPHLTPGPTLAGPDLGVSDQEEAKEDLGSALKGRGQEAKEGRGERGGRGRGIDCGRGRPHCRAAPWCCAPPPAPCRCRPRRRSCSPFPRCARPGSPSLGRRRAAGAPDRPPPALASAPRGEGRGAGDGDGGGPGYKDSPMITPWRTGIRGLGRRWGRTYLGP